MNSLTLLLLFAFCVLWFQLCSKIAIELCENTGDRGSPIYIASILGVFGSLLIGSESLYRLVKNVENGEWPF